MFNMLLVGCRQAWCLPHWHLGRSLQFPYTVHITNAEIFWHKGQTPVSERVKNISFRILEHFAQYDGMQNHRVFWALMSSSSRSWKRHVRWPKNTWTCLDSPTVEPPLNFVLKTAWRYPHQDKDKWQICGNTNAIERDAQSMLMINLAQDLHSKMQFCHSMLYSLLTFRFIWQLAKIKVTAPSH